MVTTLSHARTRHCKLPFMNSRKTVKIKSSAARLIFIALGKRKSDSESASIEVTSGVSTDEGEEKRKKKREKRKEKGW